VPTTTESQKELAIVTDGKLAFTIEALTAETGLSGTFWRREIRSGNLAAIRVGSRILVRREQLIAYLSSRKAR
jgi:excisionase family DNA binding protein